MNTKEVKPEVSMDKIIKFIKTEAKSEIKAETDKELEKKYNKCNFERSQYLKEYNLCKLEHNIYHNYEDLHQGRYIYGIFHMIMIIIAVYLSFRCNNNKYNLGSMIIALFFPYIYIIYILATQGTCGILEK
jgi:hypothetical protein